MADTDEIAISHIVVGQERKDVDVDDAGADDDRPTGVMVESVEPLFVALRLLGSQYFGPYGSGMMQHSVLEFIREVVPLRTCKLNLAPAICLTSTRTLALCSLL